MLRAGSFRANTIQRRTSIGSRPTLRAQLLGVVNSPNAELPGTFTRKDGKGPAVVEIHRERILKGDAHANMPIRTSGGDTENFVFDAVALDDDFTGIGRTVRLGAGLKVMPCKIVRWAIWRRLVRSIMGLPNLPAEARATVIPPQTEP